MATRNVVLTDHQDQFVDKLVASGRYQNASETLRAGLRLLEAEEAALASTIARVTSAYDVAVAGGRAEGTGEEAVRSAFRSARDTYLERSGDADEA